MLSKRDAHLGQDLESAMRGNFAKLLTGFLLSFFFVNAVGAASRQDIIKRITESFVKTPTMTGEFVQFDPAGKQTGGKFHISLPGKVLFDYQKSAPLKVISDGRTVAVNNSKLKTWDFYPFRKTPFALLFGKKIAIDEESVREIREEPDLITLVMENKKILGDVAITLIFDRKTLDLRQWSIQDAQVRETTVILFNVRKNVKIPVSYFKIDQLALQRDARRER